MSGQPQFKTQEQKRKYDILVSIQEKEKEEKEYKIKEYKEIKEVLKNADKQKQKKIEDENRIKCYDPECNSSFPDEEKVKRHIIRSHKGLAIKLNYISYICDLCKEYSTNQKVQLKAHMKECIKRQMRELEIQGIKMPESKLSEEQEKLYQEAQKFF